jgi:hypothetical protein
MFKKQSRATAKKEIEKSRAVSELHRCRKPPWQVSRYTRSQRRRGIPHQVAAGSKSCSRRLHTRTAPEIREREDVEVHSGTIAKVEGSSMAGCAPDISFPRPPHGNRRREPPPLLCSCNGVASSSCSGVTRDMREDEADVVSVTSTATLAVLPPRATGLHPSSASPSPLHMRLDLGSYGERRGGGGGGVEGWAFGGADDAA